VKRAWLTGVLAGLLASSIVGCTAQGAPEVDQSNPYAAEISDAYGRATSDFERDVLRDGKIERSEYEESIQRYLDCMHTAGADISTQDQTGYYIYVTPAAEQEEIDQIDLTCTPGTRAVIEPLYVSMLTNPGNEDFDEIVAQCMNRHELADHEVTAEEIRRYLEEAAEPPFDADDPKSGECIANPTI